LKNDLRILWVLILAVFLFWLLYRLAPVITPFALAAGLAYLGDPLVDRLERLKFFRWPVNRTAAVGVVFVLLTLLVAGMLLLVIPKTIEQIRQLIDRMPMILEWVVNTAIPWVEAKFGVQFPAIDVASLSETFKIYWKELGAAAVNVIGSVSAGGQFLVNSLLNLVLVPVVSFYLLRDWDRLIEGIRRLIPTRVEPIVSGLAKEIDDVMGAFIRGQLMVMVALGLIYTLGLWIMGLDLAFAIGMLAGLLSIVPYLGTLVGVVAALIAASFQFQDLLHPMLVLLVFGVGQTLEGMVLTPKLVGDQVGLHPVAVIFAVLAGGQLFGFLGILLALPVASALNVLLRYADGQYRKSHLFHIAETCEEPQTLAQAMSEATSEAKPAEETWRG